MKDWKLDIVAPSKRNLSRIGAKNFDDFLDAGLNFKNQICELITKHHDNLDGLKLLDFGCGCGRLFLPMFFDSEIDMYGTDIDNTAIDYLKLVTKSNNLGVNSFAPPLAYEDDFFDVVVSISIWTHLSPEDGIKWLNEVWRILKPNGLALISTAGLHALQHRRDNSDMHWLKEWEYATDDDLSQNGVIYKEYAGLKVNNDLFIGIDGSYGLMTNHPQQIKSDWSKIFKQVDVVEAVFAYQDLVILRK